MMYFLILQWSPFKAYYVYYLHILHLYSIIIFVKINQLYDTGGSTWIMNLDVKFEYLGTNEI